MSYHQPFIHLHPNDNVVVLTSSLPSGETIELENSLYTYEHNLCLGHKIAAKEITKGENVLKYGMSIGVASLHIKRGDHVHLHNLESEYTATFTLDKERRFA